MIDLDKIIVKYVNDNNTLLDTSQAKEFTKEVVKQALDLAANEATVEMRRYDKDGNICSENLGQEVSQGDREYIGIDKESITSLINKVV